MKKYFEKYLELRNEIEILAEKLEKQHKRHLKCKVGCDLCCMDYSVFPIEFHFILNQLRAQSETPQINKNTTEEDCIFLNKNKCSMYTERPIICRTHGLPLLFVGENGDWELSACELNFTEFDMEDFSEENTFSQDKFNSKLFMLNKAFIADFEKQQYNEFDLIPIKELKEYL